MEGPLHPWHWGAAALLLVVVWVAKTFYDSIPAKLPDLPMVGCESDTDLSLATADGYRKVGTARQSTVGSGFTDAAAWLAIVSG
jgi:hypothetical protein